MYMFVAANGCGV